MERVMLNCLVKEIYWICTNTLHWTPYLKLIWQDYVLVVSCGHNGTCMDPYGIRSFFFFYCTSEESLGLGKWLFLAYSFPLKRPRLFVKREWPHFWLLCARSVCLLLLFPSSRQLLHIVSNCVSVFLKLFFRPLCL